MEGFFGPFRISSPAGFAASRLDVTVTAFHNDVILSFLYCHRWKKATE
jgi:hypothetical protein